MVSNWPGVLQTKTQGGGGSVPRPHANWGLGLMLQRPSRCGELVVKDQVDASDLNDGLVHVSVPRPHANWGLGLMLSKTKWLVVKDQVDVVSWSSKTK